MYLIIIANILLDLLNIPPIFLFLLINNDYLSIINYSLI